jgi:hypothetical protein
MKLYGDFDEISALELLKALTDHGSGAHQIFIAMLLLGRGMVGLAGAGHEKFSRQNNSFPDSSSCLL